MESSRSESLTLIAAVIGAAVLGSQTMAIGFGAAALGDLVIVIALFTLDRASTRSVAESIAFSAICGFCLLTPLMLLAFTILGAAVPVPQLPAGATVKENPSPWAITLTWLVAALILFCVDRFRMSSRESVDLAGAGLTSGPIKPITISKPATTYRPAPIQFEPAVPPPAQPVSPPPTPVYPAPTPVVSSAPTFAQAGASFAPPVTASTAPTPTAPYTAPVQATPGVAGVMVPAVPDVTAIPPGREAIIYLNLVGEGLNVLRTVRAENLGRDYYRIADVMPEGEQWEFTPGQVVRCRKKNLSNGKHMVAFEEAPRAR